MSHWKETRFFIKNKTPPACLLFQIKIIQYVRSPPFIQIKMTFVIQSWKWILPPVKSPPSFSNAIVIINKFYNNRILFRSTVPYVHQNKYVHPNRWIHFSFIIRIRRIKSIILSKQNADDRNKPKFQRYEQNNNNNNKAFDDWFTPAVWYVEEGDRYEYCMFFPLLLNLVTSRLSSVEIYKGVIDVSAIEFHGCRTTVRVLRISRCLRSTHGSWFRLLGAWRTCRQT